MWNSYVGVTSSTFAVVLPTSWLYLPVKYIAISIAISMSQRCLPHCNYQALKLWIGPKLDILGVMKHAQTQPQWFHGPLHT